ncbi:DUF6624 domain-containing protein [Robiginitalea marina]|uniref:DUF6624 domain-containing protein n=1 Tax=Robiginitalea marina TaxID=2954105 RepID=UPI003511E141
MDGQDLASFTDRLLMYQDLPQAYGTQQIYNEEKNAWELYRVREPEILNARRKPLGLAPLEGFPFQCSGEVPWEKAAGVPGTSFEILMIFPYCCVLSGRSNPLRGVALWALPVLQGSGHRSAGGHSRITSGPLPKFMGCKSDKNTSFKLGQFT